MNKDELIVAVTGLYLGRSYIKDRIAHLSDALIDGKLKTEVLGEASEDLACVQKSISLVEGKI